MKSRNLFLIVALVFLTGLNAFSQDTRFAIQGAFNLQNLTGKDVTGDELDYDLAPAFNAGVNVIVPVAPDFYFQPGLYFAKKGAKMTEMEEDVNMCVAYVELPLNFLYRGQLGNGYVLVGFGPYVAYGVKGKLKSDSEEIDVEFKNEIPADEPYGTLYMKAFDAGAGVYAGYETALGLYFQLNTQLGLLNINSKDNRTPDSEAVVKNVGFGLAVGYRF